MFHGDYPSCATRMAAYCVNPMLEHFYRLLFDPNEYTCFGLNAKSTSVSRVQAQTLSPLFTINPLHPKKDLHPTEPYHSVHRPRRADHNVIALRNILIEMDEGSIEQQMATILSSGMPWTTCVFSGSKSLHFIISLTQPMGDRLSYARLAKSIHMALARQTVKADPATKNPSRFSRAPGVRRAETGKMQELIECRERVDVGVLEAWVRRFAPASVAQNVDASVIPLRGPKRLFASTERFLKVGAPAGEWNMSLFRAACNLFDNGGSYEEVVTRLRNVTGHLDAKDIATIRSAQRRIRADHDQSNF